MSTLHRAQILLEPGQHRALMEMAQKEGRSLSDLVREIVRQHLAKRDREAQRQRGIQALEALTQIRKQIQAQHGICPVDLLAEVRAEREQDTTRVWRSEE